MSDVKVKPGEEIAKQHHMLDLCFCSGIPPTLITSFVPRLGTWCLREQDDHSEYQRLVAARQKRSGERWSPVRWRQLKTRVGFSRNSSGEKTGDRVRLFIVQSRKSWEATKAGKRWQRGGILEGRVAGQTFTYILKNPWKNKKSSITLHPAVPKYTALPIKWDAETWMSMAGNMSTVTLVSYSGTTGRATQAARNIMLWDPLECKVPLWPRPLHRIHPVECPSPTSHLSKWSKPSS